MMVTFEEDRSPSKEKSLGEQDAFGIKIWTDLEE